MVKQRTLLARRRVLAPTFRQWPAMARPTHSRCERAWLERRPTVAPSARQTIDAVHAAAGRSTRPGQRLQNAGDSDPLGVGAALPMKEGQCARGLETVKGRVGMAQVGLDGSNFATTRSGSSLKATMPLQQRGAEMKIIGGTFARQTRHTFATNCLMAGNTLRGSRSSLATRRRCSSGPTAAGFQVPTRAWRGIGSMRFSAPDKSLQQPKSGQAPGQRRRKRRSSADRS